MSLPHTVGSRADAGGTGLKGENEKRTGTEGFLGSLRGGPIGSLLPVMLAFLTLAGWSIWLHWPVISGTGKAILGENPDAILSVWSLELVRPGHMLGPWTWYLNPPKGAIALPGGLFTDGLLSPLTVIFGPVRGFDIAIALALVLGGLACGWLVRELTGSWALGALAAGVVVGEPAILQLVRDATMEHLAFWPLPAGLAALFRAFREGESRYAALGGFFFSILPIESGYGPAYAALVVPLVLVPALWTAWRDPRVGSSRLKRLVGVAFLAGAPVLLGSILLFRMADLGTLRGLAGEAAGRNALDLWAWYDFRHTGGWLAPGPHPTGAVFGPFVFPVMLILSAIGGRRALPWLVVALLSFVLALGDSASNLQYLEAHLGAPGVRLGGWIVAFNHSLLEVFPFSYVRFPRRWLIVTTIAGTCGASLGLLRFQGLARRLTLPPVLAVANGALLGVLIATSIQRVAGYRVGLPSLTLPEVQACHWIAGQPGRGGVLLLPTFRQPANEGNGVFARLGTELTGLDWPWLQLQHGRPQNFMAENVPTFIPIGGPSEDGQLWLDAANSIAFQRFAGNPVLNSELGRWSQGEIPERGVRALREGGYRWIMADLAAYPDEWFDALKLLLGEKGSSVRIFPDGAGIAVFDLEASD